MEWSLITIGGPVILALGLLWAMLNNRRSRCGSAHRGGDTNAACRRGRREQGQSGQAFRWRGEL